MFFQTIFLPAQNKSLVRFDGLKNSFRIPTASIFISSDSSCLKVGDTLQFSCPDPTANTWFWDFGDGTTSTLQNPSHVYTDFGYFCISLTASNACGSSTDNKALYINTASCPCDTAYDIKNGWTVQGSQSLSYLNFGHYIVKVQGDIIIPSGAVLTIHSTEVQMHPTSRIVVQRGATLNLIDCKLTSLNECGMWPGIEVWGYSDSSSYEMSNGRVELLGTVFIENAHIGILSGKRNMAFLCDSMQTNKFDLDYSGGLVHANTMTGINAIFTNNGIAIDFLRKDNTNGAANRLHNMEFRCSTLPDAHYLSTNPNPYPNSHNPWTGQANQFQRTEAGILVENLKGFNIWNCTFRNAQNGILSFDSKYNVFNSEFKRMMYGIRIENTNASVDNRHDISGCEFDSIPGVANAHGCAIRIRGGRFDFVHENQFGYIANPDQNVNAFSIRTDGANSFTIGENQFNNFQKGVYVRNSGLNGSYVGALSPYWLGNRYYRCNTNIQTLGDNTYLKLKCNMCNNDALAYYTVNFNNSSGHLAQQGSNPPSFFNDNLKRKFAAGNEFQPEQYLDRRYINSATNYRYYHHTDIKTIPTLFPSSAFINRYSIGLSKDVNSTACPSALGVLPAVPGTNFELLPFKLLDSLDEENEELQNEYNEIMGSIDGGETNDLLDAIYSDPPPGDLADILLSHSPLSDTVLIALTNQYPLKDDEYSKVMQTNLPVSNHVEPWFYDRVLTLEENWQAPLLAAQAYNLYAICPTAIARQINENTHQRQLWQNGIITTLTDTLNNDPATALALLRKDTALATLQVLAGNCLLNGDYSILGGKLDTIALTTTMLDEWIMFTEFLANHYSIGETPYNLDSTDMEYIRDLAYACPENSATPFAQAMLYLLLREETPDCDEFENRTQFSLTERSRSATKVCDAIAYKYYPSPASGNVSIPYYLPEGSEGWMVITDAAGHDIAVYEILSGRNELHTDVSGYAAGSYFYGIRTPAGNCSFHSMVITK